jgi:hypothetical protein
LLGGFPSFKIARSQPATAVGPGYLERNHLDESSMICVKYLVLVWVFNPNLHAKKPTFYYLEI